jgi:predicted amidohydrolase
MICFDMEFPEVARTLARGGADMLVTISANPAEFELDHETFARARALESGLPHVYVNRVGEQDGISFGGRSTALDQAGRVLADVGADEDQIVDAEIGPPRRATPADALPRPAARGRLPGAGGQGWLAGTATRSLFTQSPLGELAQFERKSTGHSSHE